MESHDASGQPVVEGKAAHAEPIPADIFCPECAYNLRGVVGERCPECGYGLAGLRSSTPIPWEHREEIGRVRAYLRTCGMLLIRSPQFCHNVAHPVSFRDSQSFRWVTVMLTFVPVVLATVAVYIGLPPAEVLAASAEEDAIGAWTPFPKQGVPSLAAMAYAEVWPAVVMNVCFLLFLAAATGVPSYFFHPKSLVTQQQNRAVAISYYAAAPLAFVMVPAAIVAAITIMVGTDKFVYMEDTLSGVLIASSFSIILPLLWLMILDRLARQVLPHLKGRRFVVVFGTLGAWIGLAGLTLIGLPLLVLLVCVFVYSLL